MSVIRDKERKTWIAQFYYTTSTGERKRKRKRGFKTKREAQKYERNFLTAYCDNKNETFGYIVEIYLNDIKNRVKKNTFKLKKFIINDKILPFFRDLRINEIKPKDVRAWENQLLKEDNNNGKGYSDTYLKTMYCQLNAIFNYAVRYLDLTENPCFKAGSIGKTNAREMNIWTIDEFNEFLEVMGDKNPAHRLAFITLFYTGLRMGELLALMPKDIDLKTKSLSVNKTFQRVNKKDIFTDPKTPKSNRVIILPRFLFHQLLDFVDENHIKKNERIFKFTSQSLNYTLKKYADIANLGKIRLHDFRHSHASLLISMGMEVNSVADRLGHDKIETTLNIYTHLYPKKREEIAQKLDILNSSFS